VQSDGSTAVITEIVISSRSATSFRRIGFRASLGRFRKIAGVLEKSVATARKNEYRFGPAQARMSGRIIANQ
jgi:hypothetical protein